MFAETKPPNSDTLIMVLYPVFPVGPFFDEPSKKAKRIHVNEKTKAPVKSLFNHVKNVPPADLPNV